MVRKKMLRDLDQINEEDGLWPQTEGINKIYWPYPDPFENKRYKALFQILSTIPQREYQALKEKVGAFEWFIPIEGSGGGVCMFIANAKDPKVLGLRKKIVAPYARVLYLSPELEKIAYDRVLVTVAHELAHMVLHHSEYFLNMYTPGEEYQGKEEEAWDLVRRWGFSNEIRKNLAYRKRIETLEKKEIQKLSKRLLSGKVKGGDPDQS